MIWTGKWSLATLLGWCNVKPLTLLTVPVYQRDTSFKRTEVTDRLLGWLTRPVPSEMQREAQGVVLSQV